MVIYFNKSGMTLNDLRYTGSKIFCGGFALYYVWPSVVMDGIAETSKRPFLSEKM